MTILVNKRVIVTGLQSRSDLNGKYGRILSYDRERDRYHVSIEPERSQRRSSFDNVISLKEENFILAGNFQQRERGWFENTGASVSYLFQSFFSALGGVFSMENLSLASLIFSLGSYAGLNIAVSVTLAFASLLLIEICNEAQTAGVINRSSNLPNKAKLFMRYQEARLGTWLTRVLNTPIQGHHVVTFVCAVAVGLKYSGQFRRDPYYYDYDYDDYHYSGMPFSLGGISIMSLLFLGLIVYKLDLPRNGFAALRNLNFFEMMYLFNILQQIFGGGRQRRGRGYGYGYGGYGGGYRRRGLF